MFSTKTTRAPFFSRTMAGSHVVKVPNTYKRYFYITDRIKQKEIRVKHCPKPGVMIADYFASRVTFSGSSETWYEVLWRRILDCIRKITNKH